MNVMLRCLSTLSAIALLLALSAPTRASAAEPQPTWTQETVAALARELATAVSAVYRSVTRTGTGSQVGSGQAQSFMRLKDDLRVARNESRHLANALKNGKGRDETVHAYRRLMTLVRDARESGRRMFLEKPTLDTIQKANQALDAIAPYYPDVKSS